MAASRPTSAWSWTRGIRVPHATVLEIVRLAVAAFLVVNLVFGVFFLGSSVSPALSLTPHDPRYAGIAAANQALFAMDQPIWTQYVVFLGHAFTGTLGTSYYFREPVSTVVWNALPVTVELTIATLMWALLIGGLLGWAAASRRFPRLAWAFARAGSILYAIPVFFAILVVGYWAETSLGVSFMIPELGLPRVTGFYTLDSLLSGNLNLFEQSLGTTALLTLPAGLAFSMPVLHRVRKGIEARRSDPEFAHLPPNRSLPFAAALRSSVVPLVGAIGILLPFVYGASFFAEILSNRRGVGWELIQAVTFLDTPVVLGVLLIPTLVLLLATVPFGVLASLFQRAAPGGAGFSAAPVPRRGITLSATVRKLFRVSGLPFWIGAALVAITFALAFLAPILAPAGPNLRVAPMGGGCTPGVDCPLSPPSPQHPLGVDIFDRDIFHLVLWGSVYMLDFLWIAACLAAGLGLVLGLLTSSLGRAADLPARAVLGGIAALPVVILVWLLATSIPLSLAVGLVFVPVVFRDLRDPAEAAASTERGPPPRWVAVSGWSERVDAGGRVALSTFLARLPRRSAEMALLGEGVSFLFGFSVGPFASSGYVGPDWAGIIAESLFTNAFLYSPWAYWLPGLLLLLLAAGLLLMSDVLQRLVAPEPAVPLAVGPVPQPQPQPLPPIAGGNP